MSARSSPTSIVISSAAARSEEHTSELQSHSDLVCRLLLEKKIKRLERDPELARRFGLVAAVHDQGAPDVVALHVAQRRDAMRFAQLVLPVADVRRQLAPVQ